MDGTLAAWNLTALTIIRQALGAKETLGGPSGSSDDNRHASGASAARPPYPRWGSLSRNDTGDDSTGWQSFLSRVVNASLTGRSFSSRYLERGQSLAVSDGRGADRVGGGADESYVEAAVESVDRGVSTGGQGAPSPVRIVGRGVGRGGNEAPADLAELLRAAQDEELGDGNGENGEEEVIGDNERSDDEGSEGIMEALLDTSECLVAVVQMQQEVNYGVMACECKENLHRVSVVATAIELRWARSCMRALAHDATSKGAVRTTPLRDRRKISWAGHRLHRMHGQDGI